MSDPEGELNCDIESNAWIVHLTCFALFVAMLLLLLFSDYYIEISSQKMSGSIFGGT